QFIGGHLLAIALHVERRGNDLALLFGECANLTTTTAASAATTARIRRRAAEFLAERTDAHEVHVAHRRLRSLNRIVIRRLGVVRHEISRLYVQLFEIERMAAGNLSHAL